MDKSVASIAKSNGFWHLQARPENLPWFVINLNTRAALVGKPFGASVEAAKGIEHSTGTGFQDRKGDSVSACIDNDLRKSDKPVAAPIAAPNGHNLAANDNTCHLTGDLGRVVQAWQKL